MSSISAGTTLTTALVATGDTSGQLELQANGSTKLTVSSSGVTIPTLVGANVNLASNVTGTLPVANGGTGATTLTSNNVLLGNGTSAVQFVAPGTNGNVLTSNGTTWTSAAGTSLATPLAVVGNATAGSEIRLPEDTDNGTNYVALKAANSIASNVTFTLPSADGTNGQVLQTNGSGTLSFATPAGGSWVYLSTVTASNSATVDVETTFDSTYDTYAIILNDLIPATDATLLYIRLKINGSYQGGDYRWNMLRANSASTTLQISNNDGTAGQINAGESIGNASGETFNSVIYIFNPASTTSFKPIFTSSAWVREDSRASWSNSGGYYGGTNATAALTGVRFLMSSGNITSGSFRLYGIKKS